MYPRLITARLCDSLEESPVVLLNGARQTGKSTLVQTLLRNTHTYYTLDDWSILNFVNNDPLSFLTSNPGPVIIDEVQKAPFLLASIKQIVDKKRTAGQFVLTGSANVLSLPKLSESLSGRMEIHTLWPLAQAELNHTQGSFIDQAFKEQLPWDSSALSMQEVLEQILMGGYPDVLKRTTATKKDNWCAAYLQTLLQRDVRDMAHIERLTEMPGLMNLLATRVGTLLNTSELSRSAGLPLTTLKRYLAVLENLYLYIRLPPWFNNRSKRVIKSPKVYLNDTRLLCYLLGIHQAHLLKNRSLLGHIIENFVVMELKKQQTWSEIPTRMYHYRTHTGEEIDLVIESFNGDIIAIEVKSSQTLNSKDFAHIQHLQRNNTDKNIRGFVLYMGQEVIPFAKNLTALPIAHLWRS